MPMSTASVGVAVTPTVVSTLLFHYLHRKPHREKPTAHLSYNQGLHLIRSFLAYAARKRVEDVQAFTAQPVPYPQWVKVDEFDIPEAELDRAAGLLEAQLGPEGVRRVGGREWWRWRKANSPLQAEWIEMRTDYHERKRTGDPGNRIMLYVHGGAYYFGSVDEHRYQIQRHARKLKARALAPKYRLAPQFPFPCGLQDCLATYLHLLTQYPPSSIILAGDSAGGGMGLAMLVTLRDQDVPLPAGAVLISPWCDLAHSFPSVAGTAPLDYVPQSGFHHKPSVAWPPPNEDQLNALKKAVIAEKRCKGQEVADSGAKHVLTIQYEAGDKKHLEVVVDGQKVEVKEQIQMYTTNDLLSHPLVSPVMQPTLGGLPPLLIMVGGGEILRDEQIYVAHKCANPTAYLPPEQHMDDKAREQVKRFKPTDVQLQVWDDLCHVAPTLSFTRPAKFMFRSVAQFSAWALARAQKTEIEILDDDSVSVISGSRCGSDDNAGTRKKSKGKGKTVYADITGAVGTTGDLLPPFQNHMIRQRVTRHGVVFALAPESELPGCTLPRELVGVLKEPTVKKWLEHGKLWDRRFRQVKAKVHTERLKAMTAGYEEFPSGDVPPPSALAGRRVLGEKVPHQEDWKRVRAYGLSLWSRWGSKHDKVTKHREELADGGQKDKGLIRAAGGHGARAFGEIEPQGEKQADGEKQRPPLTQGESRSHSRIRRRIIPYENQDEEGERTLVEASASSPKKDVGVGSAPKYLHTLSAGSQLSVPETGVTGKRPLINGIAVPFSLGKEADSASMLTLTSATDPHDASRVGTPGLQPMSPRLAVVGPDESEGVELAEGDEAEREAGGFTSG